jgi:hypothetical protein
MLSTFDHNHSATDAGVSTTHWGQHGSHLIQTTSVAKGGDLSSANGSVSPQEKLHHYFEKYCNCTADANALHCINVKINYVELDNQANHLAHFLHNNMPTVPRSKHSHPNGQIC